ncbi:hypothetical protein EHP00_1845 [Ecytonucleospora hepatopenaei]|uniref:J domain-containing protein n=1 Tax=Ecytonucleospora hepatopenaei TaxID=646526 RepID=A0A1W0E4V2_9MICR|nr:hypothetical protein EHP00_1845 [Ecytonucleospora hepatopenaei]
MFAIFFTFLAVILSQTHDILVKIDYLHKNTQFKTYYELFGLKENASKQEIKHAYRNATRGKNPHKSLSTEEYKKLCMVGYGVLMHNKKDYDYVLKHGKMMFLNKKENFRTSKVAMVLFTVFLVVMVDMSIFIKRYFAYSALPNTKRRKAPQMYLYGIFEKIFKRN